LASGTDVHFAGQPAAEHETTVVPVVPTGNGSGNSSLAAYGSPAPAAAAAGAPAFAPGAPVTQQPGANGAGPAAPGSPGAGPMPPVRRPSKAANQRRGPRRARLQLRGINVWSALRFSVILAIALFCVWMVMIGVLYGVLDGAGAIDKINESISKINPDGPKQVVTSKMVFGGGVIIGAVYMVLFIALSTIGSVIYNLCADLVGGVEVTLSERE
jgi:hypothetical protein